MEQIREETDHRLKLRLLSAALMIFVAPPGFDELQSRLTGRHTEDEETVQKRLAIARQELKQAYHYDYVVVNDTVSQAVDRLSLIVEANRLNIHNMKEFLDEVNHNAKASNVTDYS